MEEIIRLILMGLITDSDRRNPPPDAWFEAIRLIELSIARKEFRDWVPSKQQVEYYQYLKEDVGDTDIFDQVLYSIKRDKKEAAKRIVKKAEEKSDIVKQIWISQRIGKQLNDGDFPVEELVEEPVEE